MTIRLSPVLGLVGFAALACACGPNQVTAPSPVLPLRTVRLYETGVGYFERSGAIDASVQTSLPVPSGHLDDALKTLVVLGADGKRDVRGIEWRSSISRGMARALAGLAADADKPTRLQELLAGLKGARIEVDTKAAKEKIVGRLIDFTEEPTSTDASTKATEAAVTLIILTDGGAITRTNANAMLSLRPLDPSYVARLGSALDALGSHVAESERVLHVLSSGGPVTLGYVAETPVWRTTYRLVLDPGGAAGATTATGSVLQGWALVHNDTDEDWHGVKVSLANGRPDSFLFPLAAPRYARRALVTPEDELATVPQLMGTTVDAIWGDHLGDTPGQIGTFGSGFGLGSGQGVGFGSAHGRLSSSSSYAVSSPLLSVGNLAQVNTADGVQAGALFVYALPKSLDLAGHSSALLPFLESKLDAHPITWLDDTKAKPRSALRFVNSTTQTLPAGTIALFEAGGFAGESGLDRLKPGEKRFLTYGFDLDVELTVERASATSEAQRLIFDDKGSRLEEHYLHTTDETYTLENRSRVPRTLVLKTSLGANAKVTGVDEVDFDEVTEKALEIFNIEGQKRATRTVHAVEGLLQRTMFSAMTSTYLMSRVEGAGLPATDKSTALQAAARLREAEADDTTNAKLKTDMTELAKDIERLREHMKALGEHPGAPNNPFAARVLAAEDKLTALRLKHEATEKSAAEHRKAARDELVKLVK